MYSRTAYIKRERETKEREQRILAILLDCSVHGWCVFIQNTWLWHSIISIHLKRIRYVAYYTVHTYFKVISVWRASSTDFAFSSNVCFSSLSLLPNPHHVAMTRVEKLSKKIITAQKKNDYESKSILIIM